MPYLRKVLPEEEPRKTHAKNLEKARLGLMKNYDKLLKLVRKLEPEVNRHNTEVEAKYKEKLEDSRKMAEKEGKMFTWSQRHQIDEEYNTSMRYVLLEAYYQMLQEIGQALAPCEPEIDRIRPFEISPGGRLQLYGICFGPSQGKVLLQLSTENCVELDVANWEETYVCAFLNPIIAEVPLRPYYGRVWLQTGDGDTSNERPIMYEPIYSVYIATWTKHVWGGVGGASINKTFLKDRNLGDPDFTIEWVERHHWGDGWSELRSPYAAGQSLAQGYHIGVDAFDHAYMKLLYRVKGPKGIDPPYISELGPWGWLGDYW